MTAESNKNPQLWHAVQDQKTCKINWCSRNWTICFFAQENTVQVFSVVGVPEHSRRRPGARILSNESLSITTWPSLHWSPFVRCFAYSNPKVKLGTAIATQYISDKKRYITCTKHDSISNQCIFNCNTSVTGHQQRTVGFSQRKQLPRSTAYSSVSISTCCIVVSKSWEFKGQIQRLPDTINVKLFLCRLLRDVGQWNYNYTQP